MHSLALLVLCLLVWVPTLSHAQSEQVPAPASDAPTLPPLVTAPEEPEEPPRGELIPRRQASAEAGPDPFIPRLVLSPILGGVAASCGALLGLVLGVMADGCDLFDGGCNGVVLVAPTVVLGTLAGSLSVYGMGSFLNGQGNLGPTLLGGVLGMGAAVALVLASPFTLYAAPLAVGLGATIGYELSNSSVRSNAVPERDQFAGVQVVPVFGRTPEGGILGGLAGRF